MKHIQITPSNVFWHNSSTNTKPSDPQNNRASKTNPTQLDTGSIIVELITDHSLDNFEMILKSCSKTPVQCCLRIWVNANGEVKLELRNGHLVRQIALTANTSEISKQIRLTFSWCCISNKMLLSTENNDTGSIRQAEINDAVSVPMSLIDELLQNGRAQSVSENISLLAISDQIEPVGFIPSIAGFCPVETPTGYVEIQNIKAGDLVNTVDHGPQAVRWVCSRKVPTRGLFCPIRLRAPYFGLIQDIVIAPEQRLLLENDEVQYLFGEESVLAEARHVAGQKKTNLSIDQENIVLYQLLFDQHEVINVAGSQMESLFVADIANNPELLSTTLLNELPINLIPNHAKLARPLLRSYEAMTLTTGAVH